MQRIIETQQVSIGLVIGTFAATPYIHLHLESWRRNYPQIPVLVSDDGSPRQNELRELCEQYGAEFVANPKRSRQWVGDLSSFVNGFDWAAKCNVTLLVKMSRRFIPLINWVPQLQRLSYETQYATYSNQCGHYNFGFRTECIGFHVATWRNSGAVEKIRAQVHHNEPVFVEGFMHNLARDIHRAGTCEVNQAYERRHPRPPQADAYGVWPLMAEKRTQKKPDILWHNADEPVDYCRAALLYGLQYDVQDFEDANQGCGTGEK